MIRPLTIVIFTVFVLATFVALWAFLQCDRVPLPEPLVMSHGVCGGFMGVQHVDAWRQLFLAAVLSLATTAFLVVFTAVRSLAEAVLQPRIGTKLQFVSLDARSPSMKRWDDFREALARGRVQHGSRNA